jgi:hypothetical protein
VEGRWARGDLAASSSAPGQILTGIPGPIYPSNPATTRAESTKLAVDPKGEKLVYTNGRAVIVSSRSRASERKLMKARSVTSTYVQLIRLAIWAEWSV